MSKPLEGLRIMLTRSAHGNAAWAQKLMALGAFVYSLPTIKTIPLELSASAESAMRHLAEFDWVLCTSAAGVRYLSQLIVDSPKPALAVVGTQTATTALQLGFEVAFIPSRADGETLAVELPHAAGSRCLLLFARAANPKMAELLHARGALVEEVALYETRALTAIDTRATHLLLAARVDTILFASPSAVRGFEQRLIGAALRQSRHLPTIALGRSTAMALEKAGFKQVHSAAEASIRGIVRELMNLKRY